MGNFAKRTTAMQHRLDRKSTRLNSSHGYISYAVFCLKKKTKSYQVSPASHRIHTIGANESTSLAHWIREAKLLATDQSHLSHEHTVDLLSGLVHRTST